METTDKKAMKREYQRRWRERNPDYMSNYCREWYKRQKMNETPEDAEERRAYNRLMERLRRERETPEQAEARRKRQRENARKRREAKRSE